MRYAVVLLVLSLVLSLVACDRLTGTGAGSSAADDGGSAAGAAAAKPSTAGGVPDACTLVGEQDLAAAVGSSPGVGKAMRVSPDRSTCMYSGGLILAVEVAANYDATKKMIEGQGRATTPVAGVGEAAYWDTSGQLVARGKKVFVGVTQFGSTPEKLKPLAAKMLTAADR
jgi:hypothetical protein